MKQSFVKIYNFYNCILIIITLTIQLERIENYDLKSSINDILLPKTRTGVGALFITAPEGKSAFMNFKLRNTLALFHMGLSENNFVLVSKDYKNLNVGKDLIEIKGNSVISNSIDIKGEVLYNKEPQWRMITHDNYERSKNNTNLTWSFNKTTECGFHNILGGYCQTSKEEMTKEINDLPSHKFIKIEANFHFIGQWDSHSGYMKIDHSYNLNNPQIVWATRCKNELNNSLKLCGDINVCKIASPISVTINHSKPYIKLLFGSTLEGNPCEKSYGISDVRIYIK